MSFKKLSLSTLPRSMVQSLLNNGILFFGFKVTFIFPEVCLLVNCCHVLSTSKFVCYGFPKYLTRSNIFALICPFIIYTNR